MGNIANMNRVLATNKKRLACPRYQVVLQYIREKAAPLTCREKLAFQCFLDIDTDERFTHYEDGQCECMSILPEILGALDDEPIDGVVVTRNLEEQSYPSQRFHNEKVGRFQGVVLTPKMRLLYVKDLRESARRCLDHFEKTILELLRRPQPEYSSPREMFESELPRLPEVLKLVSAKKRTKANARKSVRGLSNKGRKKV